VTGARMTGLTMPSMTTAAIPTRAFIPGSTGWTVDDLGHEDYAAHRASHRYEIIDGILTIRMAAALLAHGGPTPELLYLVRDYLRQRGDHARVLIEADLLIRDDTAPVGDAVVLTADDIERQREAQVARGEPADPLRRVLIPPTLVIKSIRRGHERHDQVTKRRLYAEFGVPNFWLANYRDRSLECLRLDGDAYVLDARGEGDAAVRPTAFPGLTIPVQELFA